MRDFIFHNPVKIYFGKGQARHIAQEVERVEGADNGALKGEHWVVTTPGRCALLLRPGARAGGEEHHVVDVDGAGLWREGR